MLKSFVNVILSFIIILFSSSCVFMPQSTWGRQYEAWKTSFPSGLDTQLEVANAATKVYHAITDTPIKELQTEEGSRRLGSLVTDARDKYRHWQSYGSTWIPYPPRNLTDNRVLYDDIIFDCGYNTTKIFNQAGDLGYIKTWRGRLIFSGTSMDTRYWELHEPFDDILIGDRIADIPYLIGKIKR
ncbi:hypothetical protein KKF86_08020 [bacterium]|nr:hypothetical protein [bacterium]